MKTGSQGTFVISWAQTETDGVTAASPEAIAVGASWRWTGVPVRVDGPQDVLILNGPEGAREFHQRAARMVRRLIGNANMPTGRAAVDTEAAEDLPDQSFRVSDGQSSYTVTLLCVPQTGAQLLMLAAEMPPPDTDLWVVQTAMGRAARFADKGLVKGQICFTPGTRLATPQGPKLIEHLLPGDAVLTRDNGPQKILWTGHRRMSGARLYAMPHLRPIRFRAGAMGLDRPEQDLLVSPHHRMLVKGPVAQALYNVDEVLVAAQDLVNDHSIVPDYTVREVTYIHVLLDQHNIIWANGLETESFHPANALLGDIEAGEKLALLALLPQIATHPDAYGQHARRNLSASEAAILRYGLRG